MPSHIFTRVGAWQESAAHEHALEGSGQGGQRAGRGLSRDRLHGVRRPAARPRCRGASSHRRSDEDQRRKRALRRALRHRRDAGALCLRARRLGRRRRSCSRPAAPIPSSSPITYFARSVGAARSGDLAAARKDAEQLETFHKALLDREEHLLGHRGRDPAAGRGRMDRAGRWQVRRGASSSCARPPTSRTSNEKHIVTPGRIVPARELLGEMLLEVKQPGAALKEFEASQRREPNRFRNYLGAARAAEMAGDRAKAAALLPEAPGAREGCRHGAARAGEREEIRAAVSRLAGLVRASLLLRGDRGVCPDRRRRSRRGGSRSRHARRGLRRGQARRREEGLGGGRAPLPARGDSATPTTRTCRTSSAFPTAT